MVKKKVKYVDFAGEEQEEVLYFNLTAPELLRLDVQFQGGLEAFIEKIDVKERPEEILELFETILKMSYGQKSEDNRRFIKSDELANEFFQSAAYAALFMQLISDQEVAVQFLSELATGVMPVSANKN